jgi:rhodanese-related sulfurtransferase
MSLARDAFAIVLTGVVLGVAFNLVGTTSRPPRGLPWILSTQALESLDAWVPSDTVRAKTLEPSLPGGGGVIANPTGKAVAPPRKDASISPAARQAVPHDADGTAEVVTAAREVERPEDVEPASRPSVELPAIPDVGRPLRVGLTTVAQFVDANAALIVDAREHAAFIESHIPGAISIPYDEVTLDPAPLERIDPAGRPIIVYCNGAGCEASRMLAELMMREHGMRRVLVYEDGLPDWVGAGKPVERGSP